MELRHLRYFVAVAEELSFRKAAARLRVAQPALSVQIRQLEDELGAELLLRERGRNIALNDAGRLYLAHARQTLAEIESAGRAVRQVALGDGGHLRIGFTPAAEYGVFPDVIPKFRAEHPKISLTFRALRSPLQLQAVTREELDIGFVWLPASVKELDAAEVLREAIVAVIPIDHRLAAKQAIGVNDLSGEPLILFERNLYPEAHDHLERMFKRAGRPMNITYELESSISVINFVAMGAGCSLLPGYARRIPNEKVVFRPFIPATVISYLAIVKRKGRRGVANVFFDFTRRALGVTG